MIKYIIVLLYKLFNISPIYLILDHHGNFKIGICLLQKTKKAWIFDRYLLNTYIVRINYQKELLAPSRYSGIRCARKSENTRRSDTKNHSRVSVARKRSKRSRFRSSSIFFPLFYTLKRTRRGLRKYGMQIFDRSAQRCGNGVCRGTDAT